MTLLHERREDGVEILRIDRPASRNALDSTTLQLLVSALTDLADDSSVRVLILSTTRPGGSLHGDLGGPARGAERLRHARTIIGLAKLTGILMTSGGTMGDVLRRVLAPRVALVPFLGTKVADSETAPLSRNPWVRRARRDRLAGRLCPNLPLLGSQSFDAAAEGEFVLLTTAPLADAEAASLVVRACKLLVVELTSDFGEWLRRNRAEAALVRPDGTVLMSGRASQALDQATSRLAPRGRQGSVTG